MTWEYHRDPRPDLQALVDAPGRRFLDVGCAGGALGSALKAAGAAHVTGIEAYPPAAAWARDQLDVVVEGSVLDVPLPFAPGEFDYLIFADVLEHLPDPGAALTRCLPFLAPDGRVVVSVPNNRFYLVLLRLIVDRWAYTDSGVRDRTHLRIITRHSLQALLSEHGLVIEKLVRHHRLFENQESMGRAGAVASRLARATVAKTLFPELMAYQYVAIARRAPQGRD